MKKVIYPTEKNLENSGRNLIRRYFRNSRSATEILSSYGNRWILVERGFMYDMSWKISKPHLCVSERKLTSYSENSMDKAFFVELLISKNCWFSITGQAFDLLMLYRWLILTIHRITDPFPIFLILFFSTDRIDVVDSLKLKISSFVINIASYVANLLVWVNNYKNIKVAGAGFLLRKPNKNFDHFLINE